MYTPLFGSAARDAQPVHEGLEAIDEPAIEASLARCCAELCSEDSTDRSVLASQVLPVQLVYGQESTGEVGLHALEPRARRTSRAGRRLEMEFSRLV